MIFLGIHHGITDRGTFPRENKTEDTRSDMLSATYQCCYVPRVFFGVILQIP